MIVNPHKHGGFTASGDVITARQMEECLAECSPELNDYVRSLANELTNIMFERRGGLARFGNGSALEIIGALIKAGLV